MAVTIRDVAKRLGISIYTVSRALDGYNDVAESTRKRVIETAKEMGYTPSRAARQLRRRRADTIGYILPVTGPRFRDPFFLEFIAGLGDECTTQKYDLLVSIATPDSQAEKEIYERWVQGHLVDGMVLNRMRLDDWRVEYLLKRPFAFSVHGRTLVEGEYPFIEMDSRSGIAILVRHLFEQGHRRIAYIGAPSIFTLQADRFAGYRQGLSEAGIPFDESLVVEGDLTRAGGRQQALRLLDLPQPPTAMIGANDLTAVGALRAANERGLVVGRDLAIAGFDGIEESEHAQPPLTTLRVPIYETARQLVSLVIAQIAGETITGMSRTIMPELIIRDSTGYYHRSP
ncbi:MAG TPA: LacI family DNA-binding transcriptional regulator [Anaerolinea sp.]|nr:LacI family DNA-binding transcriptional regulator [Anaerolinea sp.]